MSTGVDNIKHSGITFRALAWYAGVVVLSVIWLVVGFRLLGIRHAMVHLAVVSTTLGGMTLALYAVALWRAYRRSPPVQADITGRDMVIVGVTSIVILAPLLAWRLPPPDTGGHPAPIGLLCYGFINLYFGITRVIRESRERQK